MCGPITLRRASLPPTGSRLIPAVRPKSFWSKTASFRNLSNAPPVFARRMKDCSGCEIVETVDSTIATMAQRLPGAIAAALSRHPEATYVIAPFDFNGFFANEGVRQAGRIGQVKVGLL